MSLFFGSLPTNSPSRGYPTSPSTQPPGSQFREDRDPRPGPPPGLDPLEKPPVPPFPSDKELEDISDANTRQDMVQDMRDGILNPYDLTDAQLEFFTKGTGTTREELAELFGYDPLKKKKNNVLTYRESKENHEVDLTRIF